MCNPSAPEKSVQQKGDNSETSLRCHRRCIRRYDADQDHDRTGTDANRRLADQNHSLYTTPYQHRRYPHSRRKEQEIPVQGVAIGVIAGSGCCQKHHRHDGNRRLCYIRDLCRAAWKVALWSERQLRCKPDIICNSEDILFAIVRFFVSQVCKSHQAM
jgi:hypothetical protein